MNLRAKKICMIGLGNMGSAMFEMLRSGGFDVIGFEKNDEADEFLKRCDVFIIAVKPQDFDELCGKIKTDLNGKLAVSIMAGVSLEKISKGLCVKKVVRVMPNLALKYGKSFSGWTCSKNVSSDEKTFVKKILGCFGEEISVNNEDKINMITALSGSGPAYFFKLAEILQNCAVNFGFDKKDAEKIAKATFIGAAKLLENSTDNAGALREKVTSKGGTTEVALSVMDGKGFEKIVFYGVKAAYERSQELNKSK